MSGKKWPRLPVLQDLPLVGSAQALRPPKRPTCCDLHGGAAARRDEWVGKGKSNVAIVVPNPDFSAKPLMLGLKLTAAYIVYATRCGAGTVPLEGKHFMACRSYLALPPEVDTVVVLGERAWYAVTGRKTLPRSSGSVTLECGGRTVRAVLVDEDAGQNRFALKEARNRVKKEHAGAPAYRYAPITEAMVRISPSAVAFDFETYGKLWDPDFRSVSVSLAIRDPEEPNTIVAYTWDGDGPAWLPKVLADPSIVKVAHNAVYDTRVALRVYGVFTENIEDTLVMRKLINPDGDGSLDALAEICGFNSHKWVADLNLEAAILAAKTLNLKTLKGREKSFAAHVTKLPEYLRDLYVSEFTRQFDNPIPKEDLGLSKVFAYMNPEVRDEYNALDSYTTLVAYEHFTRALTQGPLATFYETHVKPAAKAVFRMALTGVQVDPVRIERTVLAIAKEADTRLENFVEAWGCNPNARNDLLATARKLKLLKKDDKSLDKKVLKALDHPFAKDLLGYRKVKKRLDAAIGVYEACWDTDSRIRPSFNMAGTRTGRLSCFTGDTPVLTSRGEVPICEVRAGDLVWAHTETWERVDALLYQGVSDVWRYHLSDGSTVTCTPDHRFQGIDGEWRTIDEYLHETSGQRGLLRASDCDVPGPTEQGCDEPSDVGGVRVLRSERVGYAPVYDLMVQRSHSFTVRGVYAHNCSSPNLQNIPKPGEGDEWSEMIRASFTPGPGMTLIQIDYSQVELVVMAHLAGDRKAMQAIKAGSFHMDTARMVVPLALKIPVEQVNDSHKKIGKACNFAWLYGASDKKIAEMLGVDEATAKKCRKRVFSYFAQVGKYIERVHMKASEQGFVRTIFRGDAARFRVLYDFGASNRSLVGSAKRKSFNTIIQGSANDVCLQALVRLDKWFQENPEMGKIVLSIHDALLFEVPTHLASYVTKVACDMMIQDVGFPVSVEAEMGPDWSDQVVWKPDAEPETPASPILH